MIHFINHRNTSFRISMYKHTIQGSHKKEFELTRKMETSYFTVFFTGHLGDEMEQNHRLYGPACIL